MVMANHGQIIEYEDSERPKITLADGTVDAADVVIAVDGIKSSARELVLGFSDKPKSSVRSQRPLQLRIAH